MALSPMEAAKKVAEASGWTLSNLEVQKILYLANLVYMWRRGEPLIEGDNFEAWDYGPVLPSVYKNLRMFGAQPVRNIFRSVDDVPSDSEEGEVLEEAVEHLAGLPPSRLVSITHSKDSAWAQHYESGVRGIDIPNQSIWDEANRRFGDN